jgi:hypothetical protein
MFDAQTAVAALGAASAVALFTILPSALIEAHTGRRTWLSRGEGIAIQPVPRRSLLVEIPIVVTLIGASQFVMAALVIAQSSGLATRAIGAIELVAFLAWMTHLMASFRRGRSREGN